MEWLRDAINASEQEESLLNKGLNNTFLNYNRCVFFLNSRFLFIRLLLDRLKLLHMIVNDELFETMRDRSIFGFNSCFSTEFARFKNTCLRKTAVTLPRCVESIK